MGKRYLRVKQWWVNADRWLVVAVCFFAVSLIPLSIMIVGVVRAL